MTLENLSFICLGIYYYFCYLFRRNELMNRNLCLFENWKAAVHLDSEIDKKDIDKKDRVVQLGFWFWFIYRIGSRYRKNVMFWLNSWNSIYVLCVRACFDSWIMNEIEITWKICLGWYFWTYFVTPCIEKRCAGKLALKGNPSRRFRKNSTSIARGWKAKWLPWNNGG